MISKTTKICYNIHVKMYFKGIDHMSYDMYVVLYLLYGFIFIVMGLQALKEYRKASSAFPVIDALFYLGLFGIAHGLSEWFTLLRFAQVFENQRIWLFYTGSILKAFSFISLFQFGFIIILEPLWRKKTLIILSGYFVVFIMVFTYYTITRTFDYLYNNPTFLIISLRYLMALPASLFSAITLIYQAIKVRNLNSVWIRSYTFLAVAFVFYGILDGLFVKRNDFFPASTLYSAWFLETLGIPIQIFKIIAGVLFYISIHMVLKSFSWEKQNKWEQLTLYNSTHMNHNQVNAILHDKLIQSLYVNGLSLEAKLHDINDVSLKKTIETSISSLNQDINLIRKLISQSIDSDISIETFSKNIQQLVESLSSSASVHISYSNLLVKQGLLSIETQYNDAICDVVKELLINAVKHAKATKITCTIYQEYDYLKIIVKDNGIGFDENKILENKSQGLNNIKNLANKLDGAVKIFSKTKLFLHKNTVICVLIPIKRLYKFL